MMFVPRARVSIAALFVSMTMASVCAAAGCANDVDPVDGGVVVDSGSSDTGQPLCCPIDLAPEDPCGCQRTGGPTPASGECPTVCGVNPLDLQTIFGGTCAVLQQNGNRACEVPDAG